MDTGTHKLQKSRALLSHPLHTIVLSVVFLPLYLGGIFAAGEGDWQVLAIAFVVSLLPASLVACSDLWRVATQKALVRHNESSLLERRG